MWHVGFLVTGAGGVGANLIWSWQRSLFLTFIFLGISTFPWQTQSAQKFTRGKKSCFYNKSSELFATDMLCLVLLHYNFNRTENIQDTNFNTSCTMPWNTPSRRNLEPVLQTNKQKTLLLAVFRYRRADLVFTFPMTLVCCEDDWWYIQ